jgi:hypothetical protein
MNKHVVLSVVLSIFATQALSAHALAQSKINYSLLVGEWGNAQTCSKERTVFTQNGRYMWMVSENGRWKTRYSGIYFAFPQSRLARLQRESPVALGAVHVGDHPNAGGNTVEIHSLTSNRYSGKWNTSWSEGLSFENPKDAFFDFVRCPAR